MAKKSSGKGIDIHSPSMVKTVFILTSLAILSLLILVVKTTSFKSEPKASETKTVVRSNGVSCAQAYPGRPYAFCDWSCGGKRMNAKFKWYNTVATTTVCGTALTFSSIYPNTSPLTSLKDLKAAVTRTIGTRPAYCCVSK